MLRGTTVESYYEGSCVYRGDGSLGYILHPEGVVRATGQGLSHEYFLNDHLGNTRVVFGSNGEVLQATDYYAFGLEHTPKAKENENRYLFSGKELQDDDLNGTSLNVYDFNFRTYDPQLGRFWQIDPKEEKMRRWSTYAYCFDNPLKFTDPDGMEPYLIFDGKTKTLRIYDDNKTSGNYKDDKLLGTFQAHNNVDSKSNGKWEDGKYSMLDKNTRKTSDGKYEKDGKTPQDSKDGRYGKGGIYRAESFTETTTSKTREGMAVHAGREYKEFENRFTMGCVRTTPEAMTAIDNAIENYGSLQSIVIQNNRKSDNSESVNSISPGSTSSGTASKQPSLWDYVKTAASLIMSMP